MTRNLLKAILPLLIVATAASAQAATINVAWDANTESNISGYRVQYGTKPGEYTGSVNTTGTSTDIADLQADTIYYFVVTAKDSNGLEGTPSAEIEFSSTSDTLTDDDGDGMPNSWEYAHGLTGTDSGSANGPMGDPDNDGIPNFLEYSFALHPNEAGRAGLPVTGKYRNPADGRDYLTLTYRKRLDNARLAYTVQSCTDVKTWVPVSVADVAPATPSADGQSATVTVRLLTPINTASNSRTFVRLKVEDATAVLP